VLGQVGKGNGAGFAWSLLLWGEWWDEGRSAGNQVPTGHKDKAADKMGALVTPDKSLQNTFYLVRNHQGHQMGIFCI
jgi:hypothetical protein